MAQLWRGYNTENYITFAKVAQMDTLIKYDTGSIRMSLVRRTASRDKIIEHVRGEQGLL